MSTLNNKILRVRFKLHFILGSGESRETKSAWIFLTADFITVFVLDLSPQSKCRRQRDQIL
jgi:hypothetical protein